VPEGAPDAEAGPTPDRKPRGTPGKPPTPAAAAAAAQQPDGGAAADQGAPDQERTPTKAAAPGADGVDGAAAPAATPPPRLPPGRSPGRPPRRPGAGWPPPAALNARLRWVMDVASDALASAAGPEGLLLDPLPPPRAPWPKSGGGGDAAGDAAAAAAAAAAGGDYGYKEDDFVWAWGNELDQELDELIGDEAGGGGGGRRGGKGKGDDKGGKADKQVRAGAWLAGHDSSRPPATAQTHAPFKGPQHAERAPSTQFACPLTHHPSHQAPERAWMKRERLELLKYVMAWGVPPKAPSRPPPAARPAGGGREEGSGGGAGEGGGEGGDGGGGGEEPIAERAGCVPEDWRPVRPRLPPALAGKSLVSIARAYQVRAGREEGARSGGRHGAHGLHRDTGGEGALWTPPTPPAAQH
jgi:hypothetical protein